MEICENSRISNLWCAQNLIEREIKANGDPRTTKWMLVEGMYSVVIVTGYLLVIILGSKLMQNRKALDIQWLMIGYNFAMVVVSFYMVLELTLSSYYAGYSLMCNAYNKQSWTKPEEQWVASALWMYYICKIIELADTFFMVARKKFDQVTFLHVYHHITAVLICWYIMIFMPGGSSTLISIINSFIHFIMYAYYGLSLIPSARPYLWWKRYLTKLQLSQFFVGLVQMVYITVTGCDYPLVGKMLISSELVVLSILFANFYWQAYTKRRRLPMNNNMPEINGIEKKDD